MKEQDAAHSFEEWLEYGKLVMALSIDGAMLKVDDVSRHVFDNISEKYTVIQTAELTRLRYELQQKDEEISLREAQQDVMAADTVKLLDQIEYQNKTAKEDHDKIKKLEFEMKQERERVERAFLAGRSKTSWKQFHKDEKAKL